MLVWKAHDCTYVRRLWMFLTYKAKDSNILTLSIFFQILHFPSRGLYALWDSDPPLKISSSFSLWSSIQCLRDEGQSTQVVITELYPFTVSRVGFYAFFFFLVFTPFLIICCQAFFFSLLSLPFKTFDILLWSLPLSTPLLFFTIIE